MTTNRKTKPKVKALVDTVLKPDVTLSRKQFERIAKTLSPTISTVCRTDVQRRQADLALVRVQGRINKALREQGLCLKSRNYYKEFYVVSGVDAAREVARYYNEAATKAEAARQLTAGMKKQHELF